LIRPLKAEAIDLLMLRFKPEAQQTAFNLETCQ
jgi:hypothetical protein